MSRCGVPEEHAILFNTKHGYCHHSEGMTVIIPVRGNDRNGSLLLAIQHILAQNITPLEIIVVEEDKESIVDLKKYKNHPHVRLIFIPSTTHFNKSKAVNCGVANAKYQFISMSDVDMVLEKTMLWNIYNRLLTYSVCFTIKEIYYLEDMPYQTPYIHNGQPWSSRAKFYCHGGNVSFKRDRFIKIGGMNEIFVGHGSEDTEFYLRAKKLLGCSDERFNTCLHMPHAATHTPFQVKKNAQILDSLKNSGNWGDIAEILQFEYNKKWGSIQPSL